ncbi:MAG: tetratricopeptide repeat protein [Candidatus Nitrosopolaris sp.]
MVHLSKCIAALDGKGLSLYHLGNYTGAIKYYDKALAIDPKDIYALDTKCAAEGFYPRNLQKVQVTRLEYEYRTHQFCAVKVCDCEQIAEALSHYIH